MARVPVIEGDDELFSYYFADAICGLVEQLDKNDIKPEEVELFGLYLKKEIPLEKKYCIAKDGNWLQRPNICRSLEDRYKGHIEKDECSFEDRERAGGGPY